MYLNQKPKAVFMTSYSRAAQAPVKRNWAGWTVTLLVVLFMTLDGVMKLAKPAQVVQGFLQLGFPVSTSLGIGLAVLASTILYAIPRTSVLGAILLTGFLGGAVAATLRVGQPFYPPFIFAALVWGGLYLRDERVRALVPLRAER